MSNSVETADLSAYDNYVFIPIGDGTSLSQASEFNMTVNGEASLDVSGTTIEASDFKYLTLNSGQTITASNAKTLYDEQGSDNYSEATNFVAVRLIKMEPGGTATIEIPVKAPTIKANTTLYDQCTAVSVFYFNKTDKSIFNAGTNGTGYLRASYRNALYDVAFDSMGGSTVARQTEILENEKVTEPTEPTRAGYTFGGWYTDEDTTTGNEYDFDSPVKEDMTLYAKWTENSPVAIKYLQNPAKGGSLNRTAESLKPATGAAKGSTATVNPGYTFEGWYDSEDTLMTTNATFVPSKNTQDIYEAGTYTAKYTPKEDTPYTVKYMLKDVGDSTYTEMASARVNATGTTDTAATSTQKTFKGFTYDKKTYEKTGTDPSATAIDIAGDGSLVIKYYYNRQSYTVTYLDPAENVATPVKGSDTETCEYEAKPTVAYTLTDVNGEYLQTGWRWERDNGDETTSTGVITDYKDLEITGDTTIQPVFAHIPFLIASTDSNGYVKTVEGTTAGTIGTDTESKYEWANDYTEDYNGVITFKAKDHYKVKSITVQTPNGTNKTIKNIPLNTTDLTTISDELVLTGGAATLALTDDGHGNYTSGEIDTTKLAKSTTYVINFEMITWKVSFDAKGGAPIPDNQTVEETKKATLPANPAKKGYTFGGWYTDEDCSTGNEFDFDTAITGNVKLYAKWTENEVKIDYVSSDTAMGTVDKGTETVKVSTGFTLGSTATPNEGYKFLNWTKGSEEVGTNETFWPSQNDDGLYEAATYIANFEPISYKVAFDSNGGTGTMADQSFTYDKEGTLTANNYKKEGYHFLGWSTTPPGASGMISVDYQNSAIVNNLTNVDGATVTLYAVWNSDTNTKYTVEHYQQSLTGTYELAETEGKVGTTDKEVTATEKSYNGFTFNDAVPGTVKTGTVKGDGSLVLKLYYTRNDVKVDFDMNGHGDQVDQQNIKYEAKATKPANDPSEAGYTFGGWFADEDLTVLYDFDNGVASDTTIYAMWTENTVTINYVSSNTNMGTVTRDTETVKLFTDDAKGSTATPETGYKFTMWTKGTEPMATTDTFVPEKDADLHQNIEGTYTANFAPIEYTVKFDSNTGGGTMNDEDFTYDSDKALTTNTFTKDGYTFKGWATESDGAVVYTDGETVGNLTTEDGKKITLYAVWEANTDTKYKVEHYQEGLGGTYALKDTENKEGTAGAEASASPNAYTGFTFDSTVDGTKTTGTIKGDGSLVLKLYYTRNTYNITFNSVGANEAEVIDNLVLTGAYNGPIKETTGFPNDPTKDGMFFMGWTYVDENNNIVQVTSDSKLPAGNIELTANWSSEEINANDLVYGISEGRLTEDKIKELAGLTAKDKNGNPIDIGEIIVDQEQLHAINSAIDNKKAGDTYELTFTTPDGTQKTITITLRGFSNINGESGTSIGGNDITYEDSKGQITVDEIKNLMDVIAYDKDGNKIDISEITVNEDELAAINKAIKENKGGKYKITFTTADGTEITLEVTLVPHKDKDTPDPQKDDPKDGPKKTKLHKATSTGDEDGGILALLCIMIAAGAVGTYTIRRGSRNKKE